MVNVSSRFGLHSRSLNGVFCGTDVLNFNVVQFITAASVVSAFCVLFKKYLPLQKLFLPKYLVQFHYTYFNIFIKVTDFLTAEPSVFYYWLE